MDFALHYTEEQEDFRKEVRAWLDANIPPNAEPPEDMAKTTYEEYKVGREFRRKLGKKGWLFPTYPKEYGGAGLSVAHAIVIAEELDRRSDDTPRFGSGDMSQVLVPGTMIWGTEEQKKRFVPPMITGEVITWQGFTEPEAGSDLASLRTRAVRDGDEYVINGEKIWAGTLFDVDYIFTLAVTDPTAPRHRNIGCFIVPAHLPGVTIIDLDLFVRGGKDKRHIFFDDVRIPAKNLIGDETNGWQVTQSNLEAEHGGGGSVVPQDRLFERVVAYCKETQHHGQPLSKDPDVQQEMVEVYIQSEIGRLIALRNYWMHTAKKRGVGYEGSQNSLHRKTNSPKTGAAYLRILGPAALTDDPKWALLKGAIEYQQRMSVVTHPGGTREMQKLIMARRMGLSRTRETAKEFA